MPDLNQLKVILVQQKRTAKWLSKELGRDPATESKWCQNKVQPSVETFAKIAELLDVDIRDLFVPTNQNK